MISNENHKEDAAASLPKSESSKKVDLAVMPCGHQATDATQTPATQSIESLGHLVRAIYENGFKRANLKKKELDVWKVSKPPAASERDELLNLTRSDRLLDRTRQLMLLGLRISVPSISNQLRDFARESLLRHPLFAADELQAVLKSQPDALANDTAVCRILTTDYVSGEESGDEKPLTKKQWEQCRINGAHCLLLIFWGSRNISLERILRILQTHIWGRYAPRKDTDVERLSALLCSRDPTTSAVTYCLLEHEVNEHKRRTEMARRSEEILTARLASAEGGLASLGQELAKTQARFEAISTEREEELRAHAIEISHWKDDYEQMRGQVLRKLKDELALLDEGLHALRREPPKVHVMVDHAERAIDGLKREMERLRRTD